MNITLAEEDLEEWTLGDFLGMFKTSFFFAVHMLSGIFRFWLQVTLHLTADEEGNSRRIVYVVWQIQV